MAGKRLYITIPQRDHALIARLAMLEEECSGQWARRAVLLRLYTELLHNTELQDYDVQLSLEERQEVMHHGG